MATEDKIGRKEIVDKICGLVESLNEDSNFCLSINGAWGSGKSFVLDMIQDKLSKSPEYIIVKYDAWENSFYPDPLIAMLSCVIEGLGNKLSKMRGYFKAAAECGKKKGKELVDKLSDAGGKIGVVATVIKNIAEIVADFKNVTVVNDTKDSQLETYKSYKMLLQEFAALLNKLTKKVFVAKKQTKIIVLVDEIDRCLPNDQLKILERLHHLFDVKNCAVIVAMNHSCIAKTVKTLYGTDGNEYLRKFFDFVFKLDTSAEVYLNNLFDGFIKSCEKIKTRDSNAELQINLAYQCMLFGDKKVLEKVDNRELTRYFDAVNRVCNDFGWQNLLPHYVFFVLIALFIRRDVTSSFLDEKDISEKQHARDDIYNRLSRDEKEVELPYYDYIAECIGVDRDNPPKSILQSSNYYIAHDIASSSWLFNEIVCYSTGKQFLHNERRLYYHQPTVNSDDCKKLRELVLLYGGEQEKCER